jgi:uncharacterized repeat protein (TIGR02543 family)
MYTVHSHVQTTCQGLKTTGSVWLAAAIVLAMSGAAQADVTILRSFNGGTTDGLRPRADVTVDGATIYGITPYGGDNPSSYGTVFKMNINGTGFQLLRRLSVTDGTTPQGSLTKSGSTLYGLTSAYGSAGTYTAGTIFKLNTDGTGFQVLHNFSDTQNLHPHYPLGSLTLVGSTLYGMTSLGGAYDGNSDSCGTVFKINTDGSGYETLHMFDGTNGKQPEGALTEADSKLYGMTVAGGTSDKGTVFRMNLDGTGFERLYSFTGGDNSGWGPKGSLTISGSTLYGTTQYGGGTWNQGQGTVFKMDLDGSNFSLVHRFSNTANTGRFPTGSLTLIGSILYGTTKEAWGGNGTLFRVNTDGSGFELLHMFGAAGGGAMPQGSLTLSGSKLYGTTTDGGNFTQGTLFSFDVPASTSTITFNSAGGSAVAPITQAEGTAITPPANPTRTGYTFAGWTPALPGNMPADDVTCVAQWTAKTDQAITSFWPTNGSVFFTTDRIGLSAQATSGLPVGFSLGGGPGVLSDGTNLTFTAFGQVAVVATQPGDGNWNPAPSVTNFYTVHGIPVVGPITILRATNNLSLKVPQWHFLTNSVDPEGSALTVFWASPASVNGGTATNLGYWTKYVPPLGNDAPDYFQFRVRNAFGGVAEGTAQVIVFMPTYDGRLSISHVTPSTSNTLVRFVGIPGRSYDVRSTTSLLGGSWQTIGEFTIGALGYAVFTDTNAPAGQRFYRAAKPE